MFVRVVLVVLVATMIAGCERRTTLPPVTASSRDAHADADGFDSVRMARLCLSTNRIAAAGNLHKFTDAQVADGACALGAISTQMFGLHVVRGLQDECLSAARAMAGEFTRRFPDHELSELAGRC